MRKILAILLLALGLTFTLHATPASAGMTGCFAGQTSSTFALAGCSSLGGNVVSIRVWVYCSNAPSTPKYGPYVYQTSDYIVSGVSCTGGSYITHVAYQVQRFPGW